MCLEPWKVILQLCRDQCSTYWRAFRKQFRSKNQKKFKMSSNSSLWSCDIIRNTHSSHDPSHDLSHDSSHESFFRSLDLLKILNNLIKNVFWLVVFVFDHVKEKLELANTFIYTKYICRDCGSPFRNKMSACGDSEIKFRTTPSPFHHRKVPLKFYRDKKKRILF